MSFPPPSWLRLCALSWWLPAATLAQAPASPAASIPAPAPQQWHFLDPATDKVMGISAQRAYHELLKDRTPSPVVVAVIDGGIDTVHLDLRRVLWKNPREIAGNGQDDDHNGYADDVHGWNFLGGKDGRNVDVESYEDTRLLAKLKPKYEGKARPAVPAAQRAEYDLYQQVRKSYDAKYKEDSERYQQISGVYAQTVPVVEQVKAALNVSRLDTATLRRPPTQDPGLLAVTENLYQNLTRLGYPDAESVVAEMKQAAEDSKKQLDFSLNPAFNPRTIVGDNPDNLSERRYGNADVAGPDPTHGTHVAGIIGADQANNLGIVGLARQVRIMAIRAVPNGDERDKDVANAIRYAVDNGAQIINMSFGKYYSPQRPAVEDAIRYADAKGVLLVHSAGNENNDLDTKLQYPAPVFLDGKPIPNLITVGASARTNDANLVAEFSNYGKKLVDVFAPGVQVYSTLPNQQYGNKSGTSMAAPVVTGMAAVLKSYFPKLTSADLKRIILKSAVPNHTKVTKPGTTQTVDFAELSSTGAIVNLYQAVQMAAQQP